MVAQSESSCWPCLQVQVLKQRPDLKLVVMSATLEAEKFQGYFLDAPLMKVCSSRGVLGHACQMCECSCVEYKSSFSVQDAYTH